MLVTLFLTTWQPRVWYVGSLASVWLVTPPRKSLVSPMGLREIQDRLRPSIDFEPDEYQLNCTAKILMGCDVFCISATGDGKWSLIYMPALIREGTMTFVVSPTNFLESDMVSLSHKVTITSVKLWKGCRPGEERSICSCHQLCNFCSCQVGYGRQEEYPGA